MPTPGPGQQGRGQQPGQADDQRGGRGSQTGDRARRAAAIADSRGLPAAVAGSAASYLYSTGPGKRAIWAQLLDDLGLRGDEHVLDVGCGRGAVLMLAARRVPGAGGGSGRAAAP